MATVFSEDQEKELQRRIEQGSVTLKNFVEVITELEALKPLSALVGGPKPPATPPPQHLLANKRTPLMPFKGSVQKAFLKKKKNEEDSERAS